MRSIVATIALVVIGIGGAACGDDDGDNNGGSGNTTQDGTTTTTAASAAAPIAVTSTAFDEGAGIPVKFSCDGENISPSLEWSGAPAASDNFAIVVDDPDAPGGTFIHWVVVDLPATRTSVPEDASGLKELANSRGDESWTGPCPPSGPAHHYRFTVYALPRAITSTDTDEALEEIDGTALARGTLTGTFKR